ncbi:hypothetical protein HDU99_009874, partial [Rhizoclosmatium hyalinum]
MSSPLTAATTNAVQSENIAALRSMHLANCQGINDSAIDLEINVTPATPTSTECPSPLPLLPLSTFTLAESHPKAKKALNLPNELLLLVCYNLSTPSLTTLRLTSKRMRSLANIVLRDRTRIHLKEYEDECVKLEGEHVSMENEKRPHLRHYKQFLRNVNMNDVTEAIWYTSPPEELKTVCECLCILKGLPKKKKATTAISTTTNAHSDSLTQAMTTMSLSPTPESSELHDMIAPAAEPHDEPISTEPRTWAAIKKQMTKYDFKNWMTNLRVNVDKIPYAAVKRVEYIIMHDQSIT